MIDDAFGNWLAGFIDGEGCFTIPRRNSGRDSGGSHVLAFHIGLRADDRAILEEIRERTGLGDISLQRRKPRADRGAEQDQVAWRVLRKADVAGLMAILDRYPLRAKKARDYEIWRAAAVIWTTGNYCTEQAALASLKAELEAGRRFRVAS